MTERPILFSAPMVRALLAGTKTQTRRVVKGERASRGMESGWHLKPFGFLNDRQFAKAASPYGAPSNKLWVREAFGISYDGYAIPWTGADAQRDGEVIYRATFYEKPDEGRLPWKPSIHMPRWASRITLEVTGVRVERLQDISEADAWVWVVEFRRLPIAQLFGAEIPDSASERVARCRAISTFACDWPVEDGTCDAPLCPEHAHAIGPDRHLCPLHLRMHRERTPELF